jgi:uncharacterized RDD family membrane protein YckC
MNSEYQYPELWRRLAAMVYDFLLVVAVSIFYSAVTIALNVFITGHTEGQRIEWGPFKPLVFLGWILTVIFFFCYFWRKSGQTLGMKTWRMKIINEENRYPTYSQGFIRCLIAPFSLLLLGVGYWWVFSNPERQTLHDQLSKTRTILVEKE